MKLKNSLISLALATLLASTAYAESSYIGYQGVAFDSGTAIASSTVSLRITLYQTDGETIVYQETKSGVSTTDKGYFSHNIGSGTRTDGAANWASVVWDDDYKIKIELDKNNGTSYTDLGTKELTSVPYAKGIDGGKISGGLTVDTDTLRVDSTNNRVGIGTTSPSHKLTVEGTGSGNTALLALDIIDDAAFSWASSAIAPNLTANHNLVHMIGQAESEYNAGYIGFNYQGAGSNSNFLTFGLHSHDNLFNITGAGNVGIGTTTPGAKLHIAGFGYGVAGGITMTP
ncbi:MAG: hypothetical protein JXQ77_04290, partial [Campylobacterales bacterium]|nr:hypothetical protein [Campylobacterales bacterium]